MNSKKKQWAKKAFFFLVGAFRKVAFIKNLNLKINLNLNLNQNFLFSIKFHFPIHIYCWVSVGLLWIFNKQKKDNRLFLPSSSSFVVWNVDHLGLIRIRSASSPSTTQPVCVCCTFLIEFCSFVLTVGSFLFVKLNCSYLCLCFALFFFCCLEDNQSEGAHATIE